MAKRKTKPIVAVVGRPNVGKSTLFNALAGENKSIVKDTPGITRDRIYADIHWLDMTFTLIDTGGIEPDSKDVILSQMREQAEIAMETADVIIFLVDVKQGLVDADSKVAAMLRRSHKPVVLVVNKVDSFQKYMADVYEFYNLGIGDPHPISAVNRLGIGDMLEAVTEYFDKEQAEEEEDDRTRVAIVGKPNVGKSSLINKLLGENRLIVSDIAGTTRDAVDTEITYNGKEYVFIDTAGLRRKNKIKEELASMNYLVEEWGGKYQSQDISAKKGLGVNELLEKVLLEAEMLDLKANPNRKATGSIIESSLDKGRGYVATMLVSNGTLRVGDIVLAGTAYGKVKAMFNERNQRLKEAGPSEPVLILGLNGAPAAGDTFHVIDTEQEAREIANKREQLQREQGLRTQKMLTLDEVGRRLALGDFHELNIIVKGDVDGSVEALSDSLIKLSTEQVQVNVIHKGVGAISESDVSLAAASDAIIIGFQVRPSNAAAKMAENEGVDIRKYSVIYDAIEEVKAAMEGMLAPEVKEQVTATIEVREVFNITKVGLVAGAVVKTGKVKRSDKARLIRDGIVIFTGSINALKRFKDDVKEVGTNFECGISLTNCNDIKVGDIIESYEEIEVKQTL